MRDFYERFIVPKKALIREGAENIRIVRVGRVLSYELSKARVIMSEVRDCSRRTETSRRNERRHRF